MSFRSVRSLASCAQHIRVGRHQINAPLRFSSSNASTSTSTAASASRSSFTQRDSEGAVETTEDISESLSPREEARQRAWYLEDEPTPIPKPSGYGLRSGTTNTNSTTSSTASTNSPSPSTSSAPMPRQPIFTTFDPERTTSYRPSSTITPFPDDAPETLRPLYDWLVSEEGAYVLDPTSVRLYDTRAAPWWSVGSGELVSDPEARRIGANWEWYIVAVVKGTGKGVVGRAEKALRLWLHKNPIGKMDDMKPSATGRPKFPRTPEETDWSLIALPTLKTSINLFTAEGRERWDLDDLWTGRRKKNTSFGLKYLRHGEEE